MTATQPPGPPRLCQICGRLTEVVWHSISVDVDETEACSAAGGEGYWLCPDLCHDTVHQVMVDDPEPGGRSGRAVITVMQRAAGIITSTSRRYRRRTNEHATTTEGTTEQESTPDTPEEEDPA